MVLFDGGVAGGVPLAENGDQGRQDDSYGTDRSDDDR